jgi:hypothetical protein
VSAQIFEEEWESATVGVYAPGSTIDGDEGSWFVGDSISEAPDCGVSPQTAEIVIDGGNRALLLRSIESGTVCPDDVFVALTEFDSVNAGFSIPIQADLILSFNELGVLIDPEQHGSGQNCLLPPCFDNVSLILSDNNGNLLAYVLQRFPGAVANLPNSNFGDTYREIFLDPEAGTYRRNVFADFLTIPAFDPADSEIVYIEFRVDEHGFAGLDDLVIGPRAPTGTIPVYRFFSPILGSHFFTADEAEMLFVVNNFPGIWVFEGVAFYAPTEASFPTAMPVYRFWSPVLFSHFYTISEAERDKLTSQFSGIWVFEGIAFFAFPDGFQPAGADPVFRFFNNVEGSHFYTASEAERNKLLAFPGIWAAEGIGWHAFSPTSDLEEDDNAP